MHPPALVIRSFVSVAPPSLGAINWSKLVGWGARSWEGGLSTLQKCFLGEHILLWGTQPEEWGGIELSPEHRAPLCRPSPAHTPQSDLTLLLPPPPRCLA